MILGNHYARVEHDLETAARFLERSAEIAPEEAMVQNSLGAKRTIRPFIHLPIIFRHAFMVFINTSRGSCLIP
jgi:hypothetical protein